MISTAPTRGSTPASPDLVRASRDSIPIGRALLVAFPVFFSGLVYLPIVKNYFFMDDFHHLYNLANHGPLEFVLTPYGGHILLVRNVIFYAFYRAFALASWAYFVPVLLTHMANVYLLTRLIERLTHSASLACFGATLWGIAPANEGSLGYYSVYGHVLVATTLLWVLNDLTRVEKGTRRLSRRHLAGWFGLLFAGSMCFGVGLAVAMVFSGVAFLLLPKSPERTRTVVVLGSFAVLVPMLLVGFHLFYSKMFGSPGYSELFLVGQVRDWRPIPEMVGRMLAYGTSSFALAWPCTPDPAGRLLCYAFPALCAGGVVAVLLYSSSAIKRWMLALLLLALAIYGSIAAGRALLIQALGQTSEWGAILPRYHYVGPAMIAVILCLLLNEARRCGLLRSWRMHVLLVGWVGAALIAHLVAVPPIDHHDGARRETELVLQRLDDLAEMTPRGGDVYIRNGRFAATRDWRNDLVAFPGWAAVFAIAHPTNVIDGRRLHFVEADWKILSAASANPRTRIAGLLLAPELVPWGAPIR